MNPQLITLFSKYWRRFLALWLFPFIFMGACLIGDFSAQSTVFYVALTMAGVYFFVSYFWAHRLYVRGEITGVQELALAAPFLGLWVALVLLRAIVFAVISKAL